MIGGGCFRLCEVKIEMADHNSNEVDVPSDVSDQWQIMVETMAELIKAPAGLIMRARGDRIEVLRSSKTLDNPYRVGDSEVLANSRLYCETVIGSDDKLLVADALADPHWRENPDVARQMISYLGFPIRWPDRSTFGTICVLDRKPNAYGPLSERLMRTFRDIIEHHLHLIVRDADAQARQEQQAAAVAELERRFHQSPTDPDGAAVLSSIRGFAGAVVHEINQPLAAIGASVASCRLWLDREEPDITAARAAVVRLLAANRRASEVMQALRTLAQRNAAKKPFDLERVAKETLLLAEEDLRRAEVRTTLSLNPACCRVVGDRLQIQLVLVNLIRNAIQAMDEVGGRERRLLIACARSGDAAVSVRVEDNGPGLTPADAIRVFEGAYTTKAEGMGLGLTICRSILDAHGGTISGGPRADGEKGASFVFTLPADSRASSGDDRTAWPAS